MKNGLREWEVLKLAQGQRQAKGDLIWGILADNPVVPGQPSKSYVRFPAGFDDAGKQLYFPQVPVWEGVGAAFIKKGGRKVWVGLDPTGQKEIQRGDRQDLLQVRIVSAVTNPINREGQTANPANPFLPLLSEAPGTAHTPSTKVTVYPLWYDNGTDLQYYPGTQTEAEKVDLASFIPIAGEYCYVVLWLDTDTNTLETPTASTPATITSTFGNADRIAALQECYAAKPNANCIPIMAYYLANAQTAVVQSKKHIDLRQMVNMPSTGGGSTPPFVDTTAIVKGSSDATKLLRFEVDGFTTGTTRVMTPPNYDGTIATLAGAETLTNKTLTSPTIADFTNMQHDHLDADDGGTLDAAAIGSGNIAAARINNALLAPGPIGTGTPNSGYFSALRLLIGSFFAIFTHANTADRTYTLPDYDGTLATRAGTETFTNKTATSLVLNTGVSGTAIDTDITLAANSDTLLASQKATKSYADSLTFKRALRLATIAALPACTYANGSSGVGATLTANANGALTIDGIAVATNDRVLINNQASSTQNGIYDVTATGSAGTPFILTRSADADTSAKLALCMVFITSGSNQKTGWRCSQTSITFGSTNISFASLWSIVNLSNLASVAINTSLISDTDNTDDLGTSALKWANTFTNAIVYEERTAPSTPASNDYITYAKAVGGGGALFGKDDAGTEKQISISIAKLVDSKATTTQGGGSSAATWNARDLNTEQYDPDGIVTVSSNKFVLVAGDYEVTARSPVVGGTGGTAARNRIFNVTAATSVKEGIDIFAAASAGGIAIVTYKFTSNGTDEYRIDTYTSTAKTTNGLGNAVSDGSAEIYTEVEIKKVA